MKYLTMTVFVFLGALPLGILAQQGGPPRGATPAPPPCVQQGNTEYACGQTAPEDLVLVPGGEWVVASMFGGAGGVQIINVKDKSTVTAYPNASVKEQLDKKTYDTCPVRRTPNRKRCSGRMVSPFAKAETLNTRCMW
jgi:hypothetical protein